MAGVAVTSPFRADALVGKVALITGGGTGICFEIARQFVAHGARVAIMGRRQNVLDEACKALKNAARNGGDAIGVSGDVREPVSCQRVIDEVIKHWGYLHILVNGAAGNFLCSADDLSLNAYKTVIAIDLIGTFNMTKLCFPHLKAAAASASTSSPSQHAGACVINITAVLEDLVWYQAHAASAKAGITQLARNLTNEWGPFHIRVNNIAPGAIGETEGMKRLSGAEVGQKSSALTANIPLGRLGTAADIAKAALFLATHDWISGQTLTIDGGAQVSRTPFVPPETYAALMAARKSKL